MKDDLEMIIHTFPENQKELNIYPFGDVHFGSRLFSEEMWAKWKKMVCADENAKVVYVGDILDNGLKDSKTNSYEATLQPQEQYERFELEMQDFLAERLLAGIQGNHEYRTSRAVGLCPLYDVMSNCGVRDLYRQNGAFMKISLGKKSADRQYSYTLVLNHGASRGKRDKFAMSIDGMDILISGHTHESSCDFPSKIVIDSKNNVVRQVTYCNLIVPSFMSYGGYGLKGMFTPKSNDKFPIISLSGTKKAFDVIWR